MSSIRTIVFRLILITCLSGNVFASQSPTSPEQQFQFAQQLATHSKEEVRYWLEQSAHQGYLPAQKQLAQDFNEGLTGPVSHSQAIYWFTSVALNDPQDQGYLLARFLEHNQKDISINQLIETWYLLASEHNPQAEAAYSHLLEQRFNQLRAKQLSEIQELNKKAVNQQTYLSDSANDSNLSQFQASIAIGMFSLIVGAGWYGFRRHKKSHITHPTREATQTQVSDRKIKELEVANKQLKRQLEKVFSEFKKAKSASDNHKLEIACAMFGYTPQTIPEAKAIKLRYRQLSKLYHPDSRGSEEEMKRLNQAFHVITQNVAKP